MSSLHGSWLDHEQAALNLLRSQRPEDAEREILEAIRLNPFESRLYLLLTRALFLQGKVEEAERASWNAFRLAPPDLQLTVQLANFYLGNWDFDRAHRFAVEAVGRQPKSVPARLLLIRSLVGLGRLETAIQESQRAKEELGELPALLTEEADVFELLGRPDRARTLYEDSLRINPLQGKPYYALTHAASPKDTDWVDEIDKVLLNPATPRSEHPYLFWALGRLIERMGDFEHAMARYDSANLASAEINQVGARSSEEVEASVAGIEERFSASWMREADGHGLPSELPIFVVGMMRSGTTLVEQILSRHPQVGTVGEQTFWTTQMRRTIRPDQMGEIAKSYLSLLKEKSPGSVRVVDKMPSNYLSLGLIAAALPGARIVHIERDPVDTCLSLWSTPRASPVEWGFTKGSIVNHYRAYRDLMKFWAGQVGENRIHIVSYEKLVSDPQTEIRRLLDFCGLEWHEECLFPERGVGIVTTPSAAQVRRPINRDSLGRGERFGAWLGEFAELRK